MPIILSRRNKLATERMDDPDCDLVELENTYRHFSTLNNLISGWRRIYRREIRPQMKHHTKNSLLDIGFGGGDIPIRLANWALEDGFDLQITAIDPDARAFDFVQKKRRHPKVEFLQCKAGELDPSRNSYDFVVSNHLLHHLKEPQLKQLLKTTERLSSKSVIFNDICRSDWGYLFFNLFSRPLFRSSFITEDGLISIKRSYTYNELVEVVPDGWTVETLFPFRLLLSYHHD